MISSITQWIRSKRDDRLGKNDGTDDAVQQQLINLSELAASQNRASARFKQEQEKFFMNRDDIRDRISGEIITRGPCDA